LVTTSVPFAFISARAIGMVVIAVRSAAEKAKLVIILYFGVMWFSFRVIVKVLLAFALSLRISYRSTAGAVDVTAAR
jgi:hypothetical protein